MTCEQRSCCSRFVQWANGGLAEGRDGGIGKIAFYSVPSPCTFLRSRSPHRLRHRVVVSAYSSRTVGKFLSRLLRRTSVMCAPGADIM